jgi:phospholipid-binding lipoprotein MlaA
LPSTHAPLTFRLLAPLAVAAPSCRPAPRAAGHRPRGPRGVPANNDPLEPLNRSIFAFNNAVDSVTLRPAAQAYRAVVPPPVRTGIRNALGNLRAPTILLNDVLQAR